MPAERPIEGGVRWSEIVDLRSKASLQASTLKPNAHIGSDSMFCPPHVLRWIDGLCYWVLLSRDGRACTHQSSVGFLTEEEAEADFRWWNSN
jgi:hypothetical protein